MIQLKKILLVDDDSDDTDLLKEVLLEITPSSHIHIANNVKDALQLMDIIGPDFVFLDINMPVQDGFDCLKIIRKRTEFDKTPVAIYTTSGNENQVQKAYKGYANMYIKKPSTFPAIKHVIHKVFELNLGHYIPAPPEYSRFIIG